MGNEKLIGDTLRYVRNENALRTPVWLSLPALVSRMGCHFMYPAISRRSFKIKFDGSFERTSSRKNLAKQLCRHLIFYGRMNCLNEAVEQEGIIPGVVAGCGLHSQHVVDGLPTCIHRALIRFASSNRSTCDESKWSIRH